MDSQYHLDDINQRLDLSNLNNNGSRKHKYLLLYNNYL